MTESLELSQLSQTDHTANISSVASAATLPSSETPGAPRSIHLSLSMLTRVRCWISTWQTGRQPPLTKPKLCGKGYNKLPKRSWSFKPLHPTLTDWLVGAYKRSQGRAWWAVYVSIDRVHADVEPANGTVHQDLKPSNILICSSHENGILQSGLYYKIGDFGNSHTRQTSGYSQGQYGYDTRSTRAYC